ncbi:hypothetical protein Acr_00g0046580 [Actinidia rufa]|uniref:Uncharacterized protein n=1 Tax=Actinidia rufa TaxID=165716 RepID=A0A7J0DJY2_9ERIC|nr:hypothetical protein Acr_00g0046580 [Actinidia rufa]
MSAIDEFLSFLVFCDSGFSSRFWRDLISALLLLRQLTTAAGTHKVVKLLNYVPVYRHIIPHRADRLGQIKLQALRNRELATRRRTTSLEELSEELSETTRIARALNFAEQESTSSASSLGLSINSKEVEEGEEVNQGKPPISVPLVTRTIVPVASVLVWSIQTQKLPKT